jgi:hypothetical protein
MALSVMEQIKIWEYQVNTYRALEYRPKKQPFRFGCSGSATSIYAQLYNSQCGKSNAKKATTKEDKYSHFLTFRHLQVPGQPDGQKHDYEVFVSVSK